MKHRSSRECREAGDARTLGARDEAQAARSEFHLGRCSDCQEDEQIVDQVRQTVLSAADDLDDVTKARVGARLADAMERAAARAGGARPAWRRRGVQLVAVAAGVALVVSLGVWRAARRDADAPARPVSAVRPDDSRVLLPRAIVEGSGLWPEPGLIFGKKVARLEVPAGVGLRASLAQRAELTLYGPLVLAVKKVDVADDLIEISLERGTLVGEYEGREGSTLRIRSPRATTEVTGTLFAVEVHGGESRVSVSRGQVRVESASKKSTVGARQSLSTARSKLVAIPPSVLALLARHERRPELARMDSVEAKDRQALTPLSEAHNERRAPKPAPGRVRPDPAPKSRERPNAPGPPPSAAPAAPREIDKPHVSGSAPLRDRQPVAPQAGAEAPSASALYGAFEAALKRRDEGMAGQILSSLIAAHPGHTLADQARYELALLLLKRGDRRRAEALLNQIGTTRFVGPAHYLRCRVKRELGQSQKAIACYGAFRVAHPSSPHAYQALVTAMRLAAAQKDCKTALRLTREYLSDHEFGKHVDEARRLSARCRR